MAGVGAYFRTLREKQGITRAWVADHSGTSETSLYRIELGKQKPGLEIMLGIIDAVHGSISDVRALLGDKNAREPEGLARAERYLSESQQAKIAAFQEEIGVENAAAAADLVLRDPELRRAILRLADAMRDAPH